MDPFNKYNNFKCPERPKKNNGPLICVRKCPRNPYIRDDPCRPTFTERAIVRMLTEEGQNDSDCGNCKFVFETFCGDILLPINWKDFCTANLLKEGQLISITVESMTDQYASSKGIPVRLLSFRNVWKQMIKKATGTVRKASQPATNGSEYHQIVDNSTGSNINFIPLHTIGVNDDFQFMTALEGKVVEFTYLDQGRENQFMCGQPIVVLTIGIVNQ